MSWRIRVIWRLLHGTDPGFVLVNRSYRTKVWAAVKNWIDPRLKDHWCGLEWSITYGGERHFSYLHWDCNEVLSMFLFCNSRTRNFMIMMMMMYSLRILCKFRNTNSYQVTATDLLQPLDLACGTLFQSSCADQTSPTDCSDDSWRDILLGKHERGALCVTSDMWHLRKTLTYLPKVNFLGKVLRIDFLKCKF